MSERTSGVVGDGDGSSWVASMNDLVRGAAPAWCAHVLVADIGARGIDHVPRFGSVVGDVSDQLLSVVWKRLVEDGADVMGALVGQRVGLLVDAVGSVLVWPEGGYAEYFDLDPGMGHLVASDWGASTPSEPVDTLGYAEYYGSLSRDLRDVGHAGGSLVHVAMEFPQAFKVRFTPDPTSPAQVAETPMVVPWQGDLRVLRREVIVLR